MDYNRFRCTVSTVQNKTKVIMTTMKYKNGVVIRMTQY